MTIDATYFAPDRTPQTVRLRAQGEWLEILDAGGAQIERWHFHSLEQSETPDGKIILQWPPHLTRIEIADAAQFERAPWRMRLPDRAHYRSRWRAVGWLGWAGLVALILVLLLPIVARHVPWKVEEGVFGSVTLYDEKRLCSGEENPDGAAALHALKTRLFPIYPGDREIPLRIEIVREPQVNAVAFLAGRIYVFEGLLKEATSAEELAGVLAHEIEHENKRHLLQTIFRQSLIAYGAQISLFGGGSVGASTMHYLMRLQFGRAMEDEADRGGLQRLRDAKISPEGFRKFFERHHGPHGVLNLLSDHPADEDRAALIRAVGDYPSTPVLTADQWRNLKSFCHP